MSDFKTVKLQIEMVAESCGLAKPLVKRALDTDTCDVTDPPHIRIKTARGLNNYYHAMHVFGHYLCDLHTTSAVDADEVADIIAERFGAKKV